mmetsp:Transcript_31242/g.83140  ORF Transcript_31242/g.83140 Transcript_31242/m.83140 type:complete len:238 (-) Transcript_31242:327-1040(-)
MCGSLATTASHGTGGPSTTGDSISIIVPQEMVCCSTVGGSLSTRSWEEPSGGCSSSLDKGPSAKSSVRKSWTGVPVSSVAETPAVLSAVSRSVGPSGCAMSVVVLLASDSHSAATVSRCAVPVEELMVLSNPPPAWCMGVQNSSSTFASSPADLGRGVSCSTADTTSPEHLAGLCSWEVSESHGGRGPAPTDPDTRLAGSGCKATSVLSTLPPVAIPLCTCATSELLTETSGIGPCD